MRIGSLVQRERWFVCVHAGQEDVWEDWNGESRCEKCCWSRGFIEKTYGPVGIVEDCDTGYLKIRWPDGSVDEYSEWFEEVTPLLYVNVYLHDRAYGGPEEGGWWYDTYEPVESNLYESEEKAEVAFKEKTLWCKSENVGRREPNSVCSDGHYVVRLDAWPAEPEPKYTPYYC